MKTLYLTALIVAATVSAQAQIENTGNKETTIKLKPSAEIKFRSADDKLTANSLTYLSTTTYTPTYILSIGNINRRILAIKPPIKGWNTPIDSVIVLVRKSQVRWANDSTLIVKP